VNCHPGANFGVEIGNDGCLAQEGYMTTLFQGRIFRMGHIAIDFDVPWPRAPEINVREHFISKSEL
jgi:hypothetical protein